jgi:hypothetical protein
MCNLLERSTDLGTQPGTSGPEIPKLRNSETLKPWSGQTNPKP